MASTALARRSPVVMFAPSKRRGPVARRRSSGLRRKGRHHHASAAGAGAGQVTTLAVGGLALGFLDGRGYLAKLPVLGGSKAITLGVAGYLAVKYGRNKYLKATGVAALVSAAFDYGRVHFSGGKIAGLDETLGDGTDGEEVLGDGAFGDEMAEDGGPY